jgi:thioredoxin-related protein
VQVYFICKTLTQNNLNRQIRQTTFALVYSLILIPIWGLGLLYAPTSSFFTVICTFIWSAYSLHLFKEKRSPKVYVALLAGPVFYFLSAIYVKSFSLGKPEVLITFPIVWVFALYVFSLHFVRLKSVIAHFLIVGFISLYGFIIYPMYKEDNMVKRVEPKIVVHHNLFDFRFITFSQDTILIESNGKPFLIETWNETCAPCIASINDMQDTLTANLNFNHVYLYQQRDSKKNRLEANQILNYEKIKSKDKILIDLGNSLFDSLKLKSYPYFLIFNNKGELVKYRSGYMSSKRDEILEDLVVSLQNAK